MTTLEIDVGDFEAPEVELTTAELVVRLADGRRIKTPLDWYPRLSAAATKQRANFEIVPTGIRYPRPRRGLGHCRRLQGQH
ncbi:MAG: DUF2442 domain-containing protein [Hyphomicrobiaceae bacterium]|nr:DUF2442 domain-containing protein [Hyphomicrobiaceae bacterium]